MIDALLTFLILLGLELVLGVDNIIMVGMISHACPPEERERTRRLGIILAAVGRIGLLGSISYLLLLTQPVGSIMGHQFSWKDIILMAGGIFLLLKAVKEIHHSVAVEPNPNGETKTTPHLSTGSAILQICALDLVFSIDSVITAVGITNLLPVMFGAVIISSGLILAVSGPIIGFIHKNPALKVLALAFLVVIGVVICLEAMGQTIPKAYIYLPLGFCLAVELLQIIRTKNSLTPR